MSKRKQKTSNPEVEVCMLCRRADVHPDACGPMLGESGLCVHKFCLFFADGLYEHTAGQRAVLKIPLDAIRCAIEEAEQKHCFVCGDKGASIYCAETGCERSFHLPCATDGECVTQFFGQHRSFCYEHRPQQAMEAAPEQDTNCVICLEPVGDKKSYHTMVCPVCTQAWFHRSCIQAQAMSAGILRFRCPVCKDRMQFRKEMHLLGIQIPARRPTWEDKESYETLHKIHDRCDASECLYAEGREREEGDGPWELLLCTSCAAQGTHRLCSDLSNSLSSWECDSCAGVGTASSAELQLADPSTASQEAPGPSHSSPAPDDRRSASTSQAASESSPSSQLPKRSSLSSQPETGQRKSPRRKSNQEEQGSSQQEEGYSGRRQSRQQGTGWTRSRSPLKGRASNSPSQLRRPPGSRRSPASGAGRSIHFSARQGASNNSPRAANIKCPRQKQNQSSLQGPASSPSSQPQGRRGSRISPAQGAGSSTQSSAGPVASRSSRDSQLPERRRRSSVLQRGQNQDRSRSPRDRRPSNSQRQSGGNLSPRSRQRRPSQARRHSRDQP
ncbi:PHD finger protein 7-like [Tympanuchus pallidicinctus]|uniref:PHD finger protein 7-like n=1 Tax=Tympanuchus pallidicinctus TaxID=109042 RepID=UPI0022874CC3|nr:PHD finger protein 7-like [Tympanuchus pallidicinctus]